MHACARKFQDKASENVTEDSFLSFATLLARNKLRERGPCRTFLGRNLVHDVPRFQNSVWRKGFVLFLGSMRTHHEKNAINQLLAWCCVEVALNYCDIVVRR